MSDKGVWRVPPPEFYDRVVISQSVVLNRSMSDESNHSLHQMGQVHEA